MQKIDFTTLSADWSSYILQLALPYSRQAHPFYSWIGIGTIKKDYLWHRKKLFVIGLILLTQEFLHRKSFKRQAKGLSSSKVQH